jgi:hypothetical protein
MLGSLGQLFAMKCQLDQARIAEAHRREAYAQMELERRLIRKRLGDKILAEHVGLRVIDEPGEPQLLPAPEAK